jgi:conserved oligomeric Golgi complex subunit 2
VFRDDLGIYLKTLRSAMIELINEDYADFVSLSANFVNLDKSICKIKDPLTELREEILLVRTNLQDCMGEIEDCLKEKKKLRQMKKSLKTLEIVRFSSSKLKKLLTIIETSDNNNRAILLERAALELIQLEFNVKYCIHFLEKEEKESIEQLEKDLLRILNEFFLATLESSENMENLERCLRIYYTLDKCAMAEEIFRKETMKYMEKIINEKNLQNHPSQLAGVYNQILDFVSLKMKNLLHLTRGKTIKIKGYNFLFNSFWSAIEDRLETNLSSIFAPGDPQIFYQKYLCTLEFLERIEMIIDDPELVKAFREHQQFKKFQTRWNLPVYFQIRFNEIATNMEKSCEIDWSKIIVSDSNQMQIRVFIELINSIAKCWTDGVYLDQLFGKFFKLTFQLIARTIQWINDVLNETGGQFDPPNVDIYNFYVILHRDISTLILKLPQIEQIVTQKLNENRNLKDQIKVVSVKSCFESPKHQLEENLAKIENQIVQRLMIVCIRSIKNVQDIPRLFRKTNRDVPTKHLPYVEQIIDPIENFMKNHSKNFTETSSLRILRETFNQLTIQ